VEWLASTRSETNDEHNKVRGQVEKGMALCHNSETTKPFPQNERLPSDILRQ